ncbi:MAG TPA: hypothetical protein VK590_14945 [Saprospiraceae bacterium]|nr:hypothetical protein [Saprospiraceae bacterium]
MNQEQITLPDGNVLLVDKTLLLMAGNEKDISVYASEKTNHYHPIIASLKEIDPSIPLVREEDLKVKDRYWTKDVMDSISIMDGNKWYNNNIFSKDKMKHLPSFIEGFNSASKGGYSEEDMIEAAKYGYDFRANTSFPNESFEVNCKNNFLQKVASIKPTPKIKLKEENGVPIVDSEGYVIVEK